MNSKRIVLLSSCVLVTFAGCVGPGAIDANLLNRYQSRMLERSPQPRIGEEGLDSLRPKRDAALPRLKLLTDLKTGKTRVRLGLNDAVMLALANNVDIRVVSFDPAIAREEMMKAAAAFDATVFGGWSYTNTDNQTIGTLGGGMSKVRVWNAGVRQRTVTGGSWELGWTLTRSWDNSALSTVRTRYEPTVELQVVQPLLRDAWPEVNLAELKIARINRRLSEQQFRRRVEEIVTEVISQYWNLILARRDVEIQEWLLAETIKTLKRVEARAELDATAVQVKQAEAAVAVRRAILITGRKALLEVQDTLGRLLADADLNVLSDYEIEPTTPPVEVAVKIDMTDQVLAALRHSPDLETARLAIAASEISVRVAKNQLLPRLDLSLSTGLQGIASRHHQANENLGTMDYVSYGIGIQLEYPLGNRERRAVLRRVRLERGKAITELQGVADQVARTVRERVREIRMRWEHLQAYRQVVAATTKQLEAIENIEEIRGRLTPEFLQLKLNTQGQLAQARHDKFTAIISYNQAMATLAQATGTVLEMNRVRTVLPAVMGEAKLPATTPSDRPPNAR